MKQKLEIRTFDKCYKKIVSCAIPMALTFMLCHPLQAVAASDSGTGNEIENRVTETNQANNITVKGQIKDANGEALIGVNILVKGTTNGTYSDVDGNYSINAPQNAVLSYSFVGFNTQEVEVSGQTTLNITLTENTQILDEVVVVGYGAMKRSEVATAITTVKPENFNLGGAANRDVRSLLEGRVAGLTITRTGGSDPNSGVAIQLRGVVSVNGSKSPLIIIDGIPGGNLDLLRPEDIESMEVLKDGSAAAIYGSSANAGVIIITTKKGTKGAPQFEYSTYVSRYYKTRTPDFMNASEYKAALTSLGFDESSFDKGGATNMYDEIINKENLSHSHTLSVSGGTDHSSYRASVFYNDLESIAKKNSREQWGGRFSLTAKGLNDMLTFQSNLSTNLGNMNKLGNEGWEAALRANPTNPLYNADGTFYEDYASDENKLARLSQQSNRRKQNTTSGDAKLILEPIKDLKVSVFGSITQDSYDDNTYYDKLSRTSIDSYNSGGYARKYHYISKNRAVEPTIEYAKDFLVKHKVSAVAGYSWRYNGWEEFSANNSGFLNNATGVNDLGAGSYLLDGKAGMASNKQDETLIAFFGRINYIFDEKYIIQASLRREGSSKFGENNKWGNFPAVSLAWNASHEEFMKAIPVISNLKVRGGYGVTGNSGINPYQSMATLGTGNPYLTDEGTWLQTYGPNKNPNPNLKWEVKKEWNIGIDFGVLKNRITGAIDVYKRKTDDLLMSGVTAPIPANIHSSYTTNIGSISASGIEFTINAIPVVTKDFEWKVDFVGSKLFSNTFDKFSNNTADYYETGSIGGYGALGNAFRLYAGNDIGDFYGKKFAGFDADGNWLFYNKEGEAVSPNEIGEEDKQIIGNGVPKLYMTLNNTFRYKQFDLTLSFAGKFMFDILNRQKMAYENVTTLKSGYNVLKTTLTEGVNSSYQYSDYYLENGNYVKLDNVTIGYTLPRNLIPYVAGARFYVNARDLFFITGYDGETPELDDTGFSPNMADYARTPLTRSLSIGCSIQF